MRRLLLVLVVALLTVPIVGVAAAYEKEAALNAQRLAWCSSAMPELRSLHPGPFLEVDVQTCVREPGLIIAGLGGTGASEFVPARAGGPASVLLGHMAFFAMAVAALVPVGLGIFCARRGIMFFVWRL